MPGFATREADGYILSMKQHLAVTIIFAFLAAVPAMAFALSGDKTTVDGSEIQLIQSQDPLDDPQAVEERIETGNPGETVLQRGNERVVIAIGLLLLLGLLCLAIWKIRNRPPHNKAHSKGS